MVVEAKPPIRRNSNVVGVLLIVGAVVLFVPIALIGAAVMFSYLFVREVHHIPPAQPVVYSYPTPTDPFGPGMSSSSGYSPDFQARISAAQQIQDTTQRDEAFQIIASRLSGNAYEAGQAIQQIGNMGLRDAATWDAAKRFGEQGLSQEALSMVNSMSDQTTRDAALRAIATGVWPERPPGAQGGVTEEAKEATEEVRETTSETALEASSS